MTINKFLLGFGLLICLLLSSFHSYAQVDFNQFVGKWKVAEKESYEVWQMESPDSLSGYSYRLVNGEEHISEYLTLYGTSNIYFSARVLDQNNGQKILFKRVDSENECVVFENREHDFPQRIEYCFVEKERLKVKVSDYNGKGFEISLNKVIEE